MAKRQMPYFKKMGTGMVGEDYSFFNDTSGNHYLFSAIV